jgi:hypothetical protein
MIIMKKLILIALAAMSTSVFAEQVLYICPAADSLTIKKIGHSKWLVSGQLTKQAAGQSSSIEIAKKVHGEGTTSLQVSAFDKAYTAGTNLIGCSYLTNLPYQVTLHVNEAYNAGTNCKQISNDTIECDSP